MIKTETEKKDFPGSYVYVNCNVTLTRHPPSTDLSGTAERMLVISPTRVYRSTPADTVVLFPPTPDGISVALCSIQTISGQSIFYANSTRTFRETDVYRIFERSEKFEKSTTNRDLREMRINNANRNAQRRVIIHQWCIRSPADHSPLF